MAEVGQSPNPSGDKISPDVQVADLLEQSRAAHARYRGNTPRKEAQGGKVMTVGGDQEAADLALEEAYNARSMAQALDPDHLAPAWRNEPARFNHADLMAFYEQQLPQRQAKRQRPA